MKADLTPLYTVKIALAALLLMLIASAPTLALEPQEDDGVETSLSDDESLADSDEKVDTNDPTAAAWSYALGFEFYDWKEDEIAPGQTRPTGNDNTVQARIVAPLPAGTLGMPIKSLVRFTYRNIEAPGGTSATGNSELMWLLLPTDWGTGRFGIGPVINFPADEKQFGADVWRFGLGSVVIQNSLEGKLLWGVLLQQVWGQTKANSDSVYASPIAIQPFATYSIDDNWYVSNGEAPWAYNWQEKEWLIPMGVRVGRLFKTRKGTWNGYVEYRWPIEWKDWPGAVAEDTVRVQVSYTPKP
jgi:hypothetical protein